MHPLKVAVPDALIDQWVSPAVQPFIVHNDALHIFEQTSNAPLTAELRDTYYLYGLPDDCAIVWLTEDQFSSLPRPQRASLVRSQQALGR